MNYLEDNFISDSPSHLTSNWWHEFNYFFTHIHKMWLKYFHRNNSIFQIQIVPPSTFVPFLFLLLTFILMGIEFSHFPCFIIKLFQIDWMHKVLKRKIDLSLSFSRILSYPHTLPTLHHNTAHIFIIIFLFLNWKENKHEFDFDIFLTKLNWIEMEIHRSIQFFLTYWKTST